MQAARTNRSGTNCSECHIASCRSALLPAKQQQCCVLILPPPQWQSSFQIIFLFWQLSIRDTLRHAAQHTTHLGTHSPVHTRSWFAPCLKNSTLVNQAMCMERMCTRSYCAATLLQTDYHPKIRAIFFSFFFLLFLQFFTFVPPRTTIIKRFGVQLLHILCLQLCTTA